MKYLIPLSIVFLCCLPQLHAEISVSLADSVSCVCEGNPQQAFEVVATGSAGPFTFEWAGPEGYSSTEMMPSDIEIGGTYTLLVTNAYECTFAYQVEAPACDGPTFQFDIDQPSDCGQDDGITPALSVYPNPFHHHLNLQVEAETAGKLQAKLYNALGRAVISTTFEVSRGRQTLTLGGLSDLPPGLYWLQLSLPGQPARLYKAVKQ